MRTKSKDVSPAQPRGRRNRGADTATYEQAHGKQDAREMPSRRNEKLPHERDESARSGGSRLDEIVPPSERQISDAAGDIEQGRVDTERRGVPNDVPSGRKR